MPNSLSVVHPHWMKLELMKEKINEVSFDLNIKVELKSIKAHFVVCDETGKLALKRKLGELGDPSTTFLIPPRKKIKRKDRSASKVDTST